MWLTRYVESLLFDVQPTDPRTYAAVVSLVAALTLAASGLPARRAVRIDPATVLRSE